MRVEGVAKSFGSTVALANVELEVAAGGVCALLGRNGAGKATLLRILTTLLQPDAGRAEVAGVDVVRDPSGVRRRIGVTGQSVTMDELLTGRQNLDTIGRMYHLGKAARRARTGELLGWFGLADVADRLVKTYSGGMRRRLDLAAGLIGRPTVLFLDEPTTGLDPISRGETWQAVRELAVEGTTVLLTTQYLDEADQLADVIALIDGGVVAARGTPAELKAAAGRSRVRVRLADDSPVRTAAAAATLGPDARLEGPVVTVPAPHGLEDLEAAVARLRQGSLHAHEVALEHPTLDEVFAALVSPVAAAPALGLAS